MSIKVGDLVMIVGCTKVMMPICGPFLGAIRKVCGTYSGEFRMDSPTVHTDGVEIAWAREHLRKINPLDEPESLEREKELSV